MDIEIAKIRPFKDHPFKVVDDDKIQDLVESIRINGILSPVLIRPIGNDLYEMVSGHRRMHAAGILGMRACHHHDCSCGLVVLLHVVFWR